MLSESNLSTAKTVLQVVGTVATTAMVVRGVARDVLPAEFEDYILSGIRKLFSRFSNETTLVIDEFDGLVNNEVYEAAEVYLGSKLSPNMKRLRISKPKEEKHFNITMEKGEQIVDVFNGEKFKWIWICTNTQTKNFYNPRDMNSTLKSEVRSFELTFHIKNKDMAINSYLPYITNEARIKKQEKKTLKLYTADYESLMYNPGETWQSVTLNHPATFDTLAMDDDEKKMISDDLERFLGRKDYYKKIGKAWKRGYLLYGPPGTGKSSLIAAIANKLHFDVYDLELTELKKNSDLRKLLLATENKSILIVEDIDCTIDFNDKLANRDNSTTKDHDEESSKVTLSGLLNFIDGLWSSCGDERIIIFTTNHIEKLDPALLRPGRMDVHIHMSYCTFSGFKTLAYNYLNEIKDHVLFEEIEDLFRIAKVTPAEVAEQLLKSDDVDVSLRGLIGFMRKKIEEKAEKAKSELIIDEEKENDHDKKENREIKGSDIIN